MLPTLQLDTERFEALFNRARSKIAALTQREWSNHNEHDPGITLLELYAYLLEQRSFWIDQVGPSFELALLQLLGTTPRPRRAAQLMVQLQGPGWVERGDVFSTDDHRAFTIDRGLELLNGPVRQALVDSRSARDRQPELRAGRAVTLLPADPAASASFEWALTLDSAPGRGPFGVFLELSGPCPDAWHPDAPRTLAPPATIALFTSTNAGPQPVRAWRDDTQGLRRSGGWWFWPQRWDPVDGTYRLLVRVERCTFAQPVVATRVVWNSTLATHRRRATLDATRSWPKLPGRTLTLADDNGPPLPGTVDLRLREAGGLVRWRETDDVTFASASERVFELRDDTLAFGDGRTGRQPVLAAMPSNVQAKWWAGGGEAGNLPVGVRLWEPAPSRERLTTLVGAQALLAAVAQLGLTRAVRNALAKRALGEPLDPSERLASARALTQLRARLGGHPTDAELTAMGTGAQTAGPRSAMTMTQGEGGRAQEPIESARNRAAAEQRQVTRAVTLADVEQLALATPGVGVGRAIAVAGLHEDFPVKVPGVVTVFVLPKVARGLAALPDQVVAFPRPDDGMLSEVRRWLAPKRLIGTQLRVVAPLYRPLCVRFRVRVAGVARDELENRLRAATNAHLDPVDDNGAGWPLGAAVDPSGLLAAGQRALGTIAQVDGVGIGQAGQPLEWCDPVQLGACHLPELVGLSIELQSVSDEGGLR